MKLAFPTDFGWNSRAPALCSIDLKCFSRGSGSGLLGCTRSAIDLSKSKAPYFLFRSLKVTAMNLSKSSGLAVEVKLVVKRFPIAL